MTALVLSLFHAVELPVFVFGLAAVILCPETSRWRGQHISRPLRRRLGALRLVRAWSLLTWAYFALVVASFVGYVPELLYAPPAVAWNLWLVDDWLFSDDDPPRRRRAWARRLRLRMPRAARPIPRPT